MPPGSLADEARPAIRDDPRRGRSPGIPGLRTSHVGAVTGTTTRPPPGLPSSEPPPGFSGGALVPVAVSAAAIPTSAGVSGADRCSVDRDQGIHQD